MFYSYQIVTVQNAHGLLMHVQL